MWWKMAKIAGITSAVLITLVFLFLLVMVTRPAVLWGVSDGTLDHSVDAECVKLDDGDWDCLDESSGTRYKVEVDWTGCWKAEPIEPGAARLDGCVELGDIITLD